MKITLNDREILKDTVIHGIQRNKEYTKPKEKMSLRAECRPEVRRVGLEKPEGPKG